ncbi:MAG: DUF2497 domain-containing protein [Rhodoblastus sp.]|nr:DUF2497 domain-containing protein [Rhodoblastus sp.]
MTAASNAANVPVPSSIESERRAHEPSMEEILASIRKIIADDDALPLSRPPPPPRLFETNVTPFAPQPQPQPPAAPETPAPVAQESTAPAPVAEAPARLDAAEMESFAEVGRKLARLDDPADQADEAGQGDALRPALDVAAETFVESHGAYAGQAEPAPHKDIRAEAEAEDVQDERVLAPEFSPMTEADEEQPFAAASAAGFETTGRFEANGMLSTEANASVASAFQALSASVQMASAEAIDRHVRDMLRPMLKQWLDDNLPVMVERLVRAEIERVARGGR